MKSFFQWCRRYLSLMNILVVAFLVYIIFFQENSYMQYLEYEHQVDSLNQEIVAANDTMNYYRNLNRQLSTDPEVMERVVREQYHMNREGEDVYLFK